MRHFKEARPRLLLALATIAAAVVFWGGVAGGPNRAVQAQVPEPLVIPQECRQDYIWNICVIKFTDPSGTDAEFDFELNHGSFTDTFTLDDLEVYHEGIESGDIDENGDILTIGEVDLPDGWELVNIWCVLDGIDPSINLDYDLNGNEVEIELVNSAQGSNVILCGFWNEEDGGGPNGTPESTPPGQRRPPNLGAGLGGIFGPPPATATPVVAPAAVAPSVVISPPRTGDAGLR